VGGRHNVGFKKIFSTAAVNERPPMDANCSVLVTAAGKLYKEQRLGDIEHMVKSKASLKSSLRIFGDAAKLDLDGDKYLECKLERVLLTSMNKEELIKFISYGDWKPDVDKLKKLKHWSEPSRGVFNCFGERQAP